MPVILIDANIEGHGTRIWNRMQSSEWRTLTADLDVSCKLFRDYGLDADAPDDVVWRFCQTTGCYLLTSNRNQESDNSLEATIRREWTLASLPVFTLPFPDRVKTSREFLDRVVEKLLEYVMDADNIRGTVRLWVPGLPE